MLVASNSSFSHSVFKRLVSQGHQKVSLCGNGLTDDKILADFKLKAFTDDKMHVTQNDRYVFHRVVNIVEKEEKAGFKHFLLFPQCFQNDTKIRGLEKIAQYGIIAKCGIYIKFSFSPKSSLPSNKILD